MIKKKRKKERKEKKIFVLFLRGPLEIDEAFEYINRTVDKAET